MAHLERMTNSPDYRDGYDTGYDDGFKASRMASGFVVAVGNPGDGFSLYGPFSDHEAATEFGEASGEGPWWVMRVDQPFVQAESGSHYSFVVQP